MCLVLPERSAPCALSGIWILVREHISLGDGEDCANSVGFRWLSSLLCYLCPMCVPKGGYVGYIRKALEKGYLEPRGAG